LPPFFRGVGGIFFGELEHDRRGFLGYQNLMRLVLGWGQKVEKALAAAILGFLCTQKVWKSQKIDSTFPNCQNLCHFTRAATHKQDLNLT